MAFKTVSTTAVDIKKEKGTPYVGSYLGVEQITTKIGQQSIWRFLDTEEQPFGVYGFTNLNRAMNNIKQGSLCRITYTGTEKVQTKFGLKDVHQVHVEVDDGQADLAEAGEATPGIPF